MPINLKQIREKRTVTLANGERFRCSWLEVEEAFHLTDVETVTLDDRGYIVESLATLLEEPSLSAEELINWPDASLLELATGYLSIGSGTKGAKAPRDQPSPKNLAECPRVLQEEISAGRDRLVEMSERAYTSFAKNLSGLWLNDALLSSQRISDPLNQFTKQQSTIWREVHDSTARIAATGLTTQSVLEGIVQRQTYYLSSLYEAVERIADIGSSMTGLLDSISNYDFFQGLSVITSIAQWGFPERWEQLRRDRRAELLLDTQLGFLNDFTEDVIADLVDEAPFRSRQQQRAYITRQLYRLTASQEFWNELQKELHLSPTSRRRLPILSSAHKAHQRRDFVLSVPALLAQMEGLLASVACEKRVIRWDRRTQKWYFVDGKTGKYRLRPKWKRGKKVLERDTVQGLQGLTRGDGSSAAPSIFNTVSHIRGGEAEMRNRILHGTHTTYGRTSRHSSKLLLIILKLAKEVRLLQEESGKI